MSEYTDIEHRAFWNQPVINRMTIVRKSFNFNSTKNTLIKIVWSCWKCKRYFVIKLNRRCPHCKKLN